MFETTEMNFLRYVAGISFQYEHKDEDIIKKLKI
jgi:hypothetical protein